MADTSFCSGDREPEASKLLESTLKSPQKPPLGFLQESPQEPTLQHPLESPLGNPDESKRVQDPVSVQSQCPMCGKLFNSQKNLRVHEKRQHSGVSKLKKTQSYSNSFKLEVLEKVKEVGIVAAQKTFGIPDNTIKG